MPPRQKEKLSFDKDMDVLKALEESQVQQIVKLLNRKRPNKVQVRKHAPAGFLRLLIVYSKLLGTADATEEAKQLASPMTEWFEEKIPNVEARPGYVPFLELSEEVLGGATVNIPSASDRSMRAMQKSLGSIDGVGSYHSLVGAEHIPHLRVFLRNGDDVLLDSTGDWDDWLYVIKSLVVALEEQSGSLAETPNAWNGIAWQKVLDHLKVIKKELRTFDKRIRDNAPPKTRTASRRKNK